MDAPTPPKVHAPHGWVLWGGATVLLGAAVAFVYAVAEWFTPGTGLSDAPLIVLVTLNTLIVYRLGCSLSKDLGRLFAFLPEAGRDPQASVNRLLGDPILFLAGILFASFVAFMVWQGNPWEAPAQDPSLRALLTAFLFCNNLMIGAVLFAIVRFWHMLLKEMPNVEISILNLASPALCALLTVNSRLVMGTALVGSLAVCSIPLSDLTMNPVTKLFSGFTLALVVATYSVPMLPLSNLLAAKKAEALNHIERRIEAHVRIRSGLDPLPVLPIKESELPKLGDLIEARDLVASVRTLPPGGQFSVSAAAVVTFLSLLPTFIDLVVDRLAVLSGVK